MKNLSATALSIATLSIALLTFLEYFAPDPPLNAEQTELLVGLCALTVVGIRWIARRVRWQAVRP
jgi:hypothetical protein